MEVRTRVFLLAVILIGLAVINSCKKDDYAVYDRDGNGYHSVTIGTQVWLVENLKTTTLNDGSSIMFAKENIMWSSTTTPGYCFMSYSETVTDPYGALYNWYSVSSGKLCPAGWHVPTENDWITLANFVGGNGGMLKEVGTEHWEVPNTGATNETGFSAVQGGMRQSDGIFSGEFCGNWWTATEFDTENALYHYLSNMSIDIGPSVAGAHLNKRYGLSVRCLKD